MALSKKRQKELEALETEDTKICRICKQVKSLCDFYFSAKDRKFAQAFCKECDQEKAKERHLQAKYKITLKEYDKILEKQDGGCKICKIKTPGRQGRFHFDHDHLTGKIRGLLCNKCNLGLGQFKDDPEILIAAAHYLINSRK